MVEKVHLVPSTRRVWLGFFASCFLVALGCFEVHRGNVFGWFFIIFFGLGVLAPVMLRSRTTWLELDEQGFTLCHSSRQSRHLWSHVTEITIWRGVVSFKLSPEHETVARAISGYDGSIPDVFKLRPPSLLELMVKFKQNADHPPQTTAI